MTRVRPTLLPVVIAALVAALVGLLAEKSALATIRNELDQTLLLTSRAVEAEIDRFRALPDVAGEDARIRAALIDPRALNDANAYLETVAGHAGAAELFLINAEGRTIAASNWNKPGSFVGQYYSFRPYFRQALESGRGQFYAIGVTTGVPGFFLSTRVASGRTQGVLVVKLDLRPLQQTWRSAGAEVALADADGIVFLSGREDWLYRPLSPLTEQALSDLAETRAYDGVALAGAEPLLAAEPLGADVTGNEWIARVGGIEGTGWQLLASHSRASVTAFSVAWAAAAALVALGVAVGFKAWDQRRQIVALRLSQSEKLEAMVAARTVDLAREIEARTQAEAELRATQEQLIHTEKMAALGRMSTAIVHEISQPLAAMEATLTAAEIGLPADEGRIAPRLATARGLIRRMQRTIKHLKSFGRKGPSELTPTDLGAVVQAAIELVTPRARTVGVMPTVALPSRPCLVLAGPVRMEQVVVNLLLNALDAVEGLPQGRVQVSIAPDGDRHSLKVSDTGAGISPDDLSRVTEPFFSTKTTGEGLGLGLSISKAIVAEFGGELTVHSRFGSGTEVTVSLPVLLSTTEAAE